MVRIVIAALVVGALVLSGCGPAPQQLQAKTLPPEIEPEPGPTPPPVEPEPERKRSPMAPVMFYIPNRVKDIVDIISFGISPPSIPYLFPASVHANAHATRAIQVGAGNTHGVFLGKGYDYDFAWRFEHDELSILPLTICDMRHYTSTDDDEVERVGMLFPSDPPFEDGEMDYWAIGAHAGLLVVAVEADVHPVEILDAVLGFLFIDIMGDDL
jgi:hypothetical protein